MSLRTRRALLGLVITIAASAALPAYALAATNSVTVTPSDLQAGGSPSVTTALTFAPGSGDTPKTVVTNLAPGLLSNLNANPSCIQGTQQQLTAACLVGTASVTTSPSLSISGNLYLVPPATGSSDVAGIEAVLTTILGTMNQYTGVTFNPSSPGSLTLTTANLANETSLGVQITGLTTTLNPTLNGRPFNRVPTSCSGATSTMSVTYYGSTPPGSASSSFTPTGCAGLPYSPNLSAAVTAGSGGAAELTSTVTQAADEAASHAITIQFPSGLKPNAVALEPCLSGTPCTIGTATATSPLVPGTLNGTVTMGGSALAPTLAISFPAPINLTINGTVDLSSNSVTFSNVPDVPLTNLSLNVTGVNGQRVFMTDCKPASITGGFTSQSGQTHTATALVSYTGCPSATGTGTGPSQKPRSSGSVGGLASGHPRLRFKITDANGAKIAAVAIGLPGGLRFSRSAIVADKVCTTKGKKKCATIVRVNGLRLSGASAKRVAIKGGKLVITLKKAATSLTITAAGPLVVESKSLEAKAKHHKVGTLRFTLKVTTANHKTTLLTLKVKG